MADYRHALQTLYRAPLADFIAERKRLTAGLRAGGDAEGAKQLAQCRRPTASAWTVNQLYWDERSSFDALLAAAAPVAKGDLRAMSAYREALGELRKRAAARLRNAGHPAAAGTLRRVMGTLAAVAAAGGFDPDPPGALATDREPPGFDAIGQPARTLRSRLGGDSQGRRAAATRDAAPKRQAARLEEHRAKKQAELKARQRERVETAVRDAHAELRRRERALTLLQKDLRAAEKAVEDARGSLGDLERKLRALDDDAD
jgi:hypothetical protein